MTEHDCDDSGPQQADASRSFPPGPHPVRHIVTPFARAGRFYAQSWQDYLGRQATELPVARPTLALAAQAFIDEFVMMSFRLVRRMGDPQGFDRIEDEAAAALEFYRRTGWLDNPEGFFASPPPLTDVTVRHKQDRRRSHERIRFDSGYAPNPGEPGAERWLSYTGNDREYALVLRHDEPRPWLVCIHGSAMGRAAIDLRLFRAWHLHEDLGLNVVLPVLPMHGPRRRGLPDGASWPGEDVLDNVHATGQAVWDIRRLLSWIRLQEPGSPIGLNSMSLGGYIASLVASLEDDLTCAILGVPVVNLFEMLGHHGAGMLSRDDPRTQLMEKVAPIGRMLSPLSLAPRVPMQGRFVYAGVADQIVHPRAHAVRLWEHWGRPQAHWYRGGHTGFFRSRPVQEFIDDALAQSGLIQPSQTSAGV